MKPGTCRFRHLPVMPHPVPGELVSSWLLRVAAQNCISLGELLQAVKLTYPKADVPFASLDYDLPSDFRAGLAQLCRTLPNTIRKLEWQNRFPGVPRQMFLAYSCPSDSTRVAGKRARYEFCLSCLHETSTENSPAVIRAVWSLAPITHCHLHQCPLLSHCPQCQRTDPLRFPTLPRDPRLR